MSIATIPAEWKEEKPFTYFSLIIWHDMNHSADVHIDFEHCNDATSYLKNQLEYFDNIKAATIREEIIYHKTEESILSVSSPVIQYDCKKGFSI